MNLNDVRVEVNDEIKYYVGQYVTFSSKEGIVCGKIDRIDSLGFVIRVMYSEWHGLSDGDTYFMSKELAEFKIITEAEANKICSPSLGYLRSLESKYKYREIKINYQECVLYGKLAYISTEFIYIKCKLGISGENCKSYENTIIHIPFDKESCISSLSKEELVALYLKELGKDIGKYDLGERYLLDNLILEYETKMGYSTNKLLISNLTDNTRLVFTLHREGIRFLEDVTRYTEEQVNSFKGIGKSKMIELETLLAENGLSFKNEVDYEDQEEPMHYNELDLRNLTDNGRLINTLIWEKDITCLDEVADFTEKEIISLRGMGSSEIDELKRLLNEHGSSFKKESELVFERGMCSERAFNVLMKNNIRSFDELKVLSKNDIRNLRGAGVAVFDELCELIEKVK